MWFIFRSSFIWPNSYNNTPKNGQAIAHNVLPFSIRNNNEIFKVDYPKTIKILLIFVDFYKRQLLPISLMVSLEIFCFFDNFLVYQNQNIVYWILDQINKKCFICKFSEVFYFLFQAKTNKFFLFYYKYKVIKIFSPKLI